MGKFLETPAGKKVPVCCIVVQDARDVALTVAKKTGVRHETPQILLLKNKQCVWNTSHNNITSQNLQEEVEKY